MHASDRYKLVNDFADKDSSKTSRKGGKKPSRYQIGIGLTKHELSSRYTIADTHIYL